MRLQKRRGIVDIWNYRPAEADPTRCYTPPQEKTPGIARGQRGLARGTGGQRVDPIERQVGRWPGCHIRVHEKEALQWPGQLPEGRKSKFMQA